MEIIFYSTHCPTCKVLETKLKQKNINYIENDNVGEMQSLGLKSAPALKVDGKLMSFKESCDWIKMQGGTSN